VRAGITLIVALSAVGAKQLGMGPALAVVDRPAADASADPAVDLYAAMMEPQRARPAIDERATIDAQPAPTDRTWIGADGRERYQPAAGHVRYFNGRPIRPVRTVWMVTTAYSPDHRSCGKWADGKTASLKSVWTNGMESVAADTRLLPFGSLVSVPGYAGDRVVPVLDRGGAIKGARLDLLYPTHAIARQWGKKRQQVTIWEYADEG